MYSRTFQIEHVRTIAENGDPNAAFNLAWRCHIGHGTTTNRTEAQRWYEKAASLGIREAAEILQLIQAEALCDTEFNALIEPLSLPRSYHRTWLIITPIILVSLAILVVLQGIAARQSSVIDSTTQQDVQQLPASPANAPKEHTREGTALAVPEPPPVRVNPQEPPHNLPSDATQDSTPTPALPPARPDFSGIAERWLSDENDIVLPARPNH